LEENNSTDQEEIVNPQNNLQPISEEGSKVIEEISDREEE
jgi:hypothetical protein